MDVSFRPTKLSDLQHCLSMIRDATLHSDGDVPVLLNLWRDLIRSGCAVSTVMIDRTASPCSIIFFGLRAFITSEFSTYLKTDAPPHVVRQALDWQQRGLRPFSTLEEIKRASSGNADGLSLLCLHSGGPDWPEAQQFDRLHRGPEHARVAKEETRAIFDKQGSWITYAIQGYNLAEFLYEAYDDPTNTWALGAGMSLWNDYAEHYRKSPGITTKRARLYGITKEEANQNFGCLIAPILNFRPARFHFSSGEQLMLHYAVSGFTDAEIAQHLSVSVQTIKKRFSAVFDKVERTAPELLPQPVPGNPREDQRRGPEKRRRLLHYLQNHLEELRPHY